MPPFPWKKVKEMANTFHWDNWRSHFHIMPSKKREKTNSGLESRKMKIFHSNKENPQFIFMILEYFIPKTEWLEMKCGKCLYQHSFQDKWIQVKWDMQTKPQLLQCNSLPVAWRYFCQKKFCKSSRYFVLFFHISIQSLKRKKFWGKSKEQCSFNQGKDWFGTQRYLYSKIKYF